MGAEETEQQRDRKRGTEMEKDALRARDVVALADATTRYELAVLICDAGAGRLLQVEFLYVPRSVEAEIEMTVTQYNLYCID